MSRWRRAVEGEAGGRRRAGDGTGQEGREGHGRGGRHRQTGGSEAGGGGGTGVLDIGRRAVGGVKVGGETVVRGGKFENDQ